MALYRHQPVDLIDLGGVSIQPPDQGGFVMYVGVRAKNVHGATATLTAAVRELTGPRVVSLEHRPVRLIDDGEWAVPERPTQDLANVPVCSTMGTVDFDGTSWRLEVTLADRDGREGQAAVTIVPECDPVDTFGCACACDADGLPEGSCVEPPP